MVPLTPFRTVLEAGQQSHAVHLRLLGQYVVTTGLALALAQSGYGIAGQFAAVTVGAWLLHVAFLRRSGWAHRELWTAIGDLRNCVATRRQLAHLNRPAFILNLCGRAGLLTDSLVVAALLGPRLVVPLFITQRLASIAQMQLQAVGNATWAGLGQLHAQRDRAGFDRHLIELTSIVSALGMAVLLPIVAHNRQFVALWVGPERYGGELVSVIAALNAYVLGLVSLWGWCFSATGEMRRMLTSSIASTILNLAATFMLTWRFGIVGPLLGTTIALVGVMAWRLPVLVERTFGTPARAILAAGCRPAVIGLPLGAVLWIIAGLQPADSWPELIAHSLADICVFVLLWWRLLLGADERERWRLRLRTITAIATSQPAAA
jgi:O-antigen/teichoic acid export membrane protein